MRLLIGRRARALSAVVLPLFAVMPAAANHHRPPPPGTVPVLWRFTIPSNVPGQHIGVGADGRVYTTSFDPPDLYALSPQGSLLWSLAVGTGGYWPITFATDGTIYTGAADGIRAVRPDGTLRWSSDLGSWFNAGPSVGPDGNLYAAADDLGFFSLDPDGSLRWATPGDPVPAGLSFEADQIVFGEGRQFSGIHFLRSGPWISTYAFDREGNQLWLEANVGLAGGPSSNPRLLPDGRLVFRWGAGSLAALRQDATVDWIAPHPDGAQELVTPAVGPDGSIYAGDQYGGQLWSVRPDGSTRWVHGAIADDHLGATGLGVSPDNRVLIASGWTWSGVDGMNHGWIRGHDPSNGTLLWQLDLEPEGGLPQIARTIAPAFAPGGGTAYVATWFTGNGVGHTYLYALGVGAPTTDVPPGGDGRAAGPELTAAPNPCFTAARVRLRSASAGPVSVVIHDVAGREVCRLFQGAIAGPEIQLEWNLRDERGRVVDPGVYFVRAAMPSGKAMARVVVTP